MSATRFYIASLRGHFICCSPSIILRPPPRLNAMDQHRVHTNMIDNFLCSEVISPIRHDLSPSHSHQFLTLLVVGSGVPVRKTGNDLR